MSRASYEFDPPRCQLPHAAVNDGDSLRISRTDTPWFVIERLVIRCWRHAGDAPWDDRRATGPADGPDPGCNAPEFDSNPAWARSGVLGPSGHAESPTQLSHRRKSRPVDRLRSRAQLALLIP